MSAYKQSTEQVELNWCCIAAVNNQDILRRNLAASPIFQENPELLNTQVGAASAAQAYNNGLKNTEAEIVVFAHQDVYLPTGWETQLAQRVRELDQLDPSWAVAGPIGLGHNGALRGRVWSAGIGGDVGHGQDLPSMTTCLDELLIVLKRSSGLVFDANLPSFHLYGTDIVQTANRAHLGAYVIDAPVIHNSQPVKSLRGGYTDAYHYMQKKMAGLLPVPTLVVDITEDNSLIERANKRDNWRYMRRQLSRYLKLLKLGQILPSRTPNPQTVARKIGYE